MAIDEKHKGYLITLGQLSAFNDKLKTNGTVANATKADTATNLANPPSLTHVSSKNTITVTAGGKTSAEFTVPYATKAASADSATLDSKGNDIAKILGDLQTSVAALQQITTGSIHIKIIPYGKSLPDVHDNPNSDEEEERERAPQENVIYFLNHVHSKNGATSSELGDKQDGTGDYYDEYVFIYDDASEDDDGRQVYGRYELIGNTDIDLSNYVTSKALGDKGYITKTAADGAYLAKNGKAASATSADSANSAKTAGALSVSAAVGSASTPVYIDANGKPVACNAMQSFTVATDTDINDIFNS